MMNKRIRYFYSKMTEGPRFRLTFDRGDDVWCDSIQLKYSFWGKHYWHCLFIDLARQKEENTVIS